jgi:class 3 adenylate cyclase/alpha-beta hydrolase superfamily lysophospholipase
VTELPETRYARTADGLSIAYQQLGEGPTDVVLLPSFSCIDVMWEEATFARMLTRLAGIGRLICLDYRGLGASDPVPLGAVPSPEDWMEDLRVVLDTVGSTSASIIANGSAGFIGMTFAATYPERTYALILVDTAVRVLWSEEYRFGVDARLHEQTIQSTMDVWGTTSLASYAAPSRAGDKRFCKWLARYERGAASRATAGTLIRWSSSLDHRIVLPAIRVPTLVLHHRANQLFPLDFGRYLAEHISGARLITLPGSDTLLFTEGADEIVDHIEEFVTGVPPVREPNRALATVLFTDLVGSTEHAADLGDKRWTELLHDHDALVDRELVFHRGRKLKDTGDGILATFDGPARAVRCAQAICQGVRPLGIEVRAGLHTGEVELCGDDIRGIAVHIGQRVSALARPGEVLVTRTVVDLVTGSGIAFADCGEHELKGVPGTWKLFVVEA